MPPADHDLLREFAATQSEPAFAELVARHLPLVHSAALRRVNGDAHLAQEIAQAVFLILARKAGGIGEKAVLTGWLWRTTQFVAADALRQNARRREREHQAYLESAMSQTETDEAWQQLAPVLDDAMNALRTADRDAVLLRYFENKPLAEVGAALGVSEDAARVRVNRALEKLRALLAKQGVTLTLTLIATAVLENSVKAAPVELVIKTGTIAGKGLAATKSITALVKSTMKTMTWMKIKFAVLTGAVVLLSAGAVATSSLFGKSAGDAVAFEVEGTITYEIAPNQRGSYKVTKHFVVERMGNQWKIHTATMNEEGTGFGAPGGGSMDLYYEMGFDGTNDYRLLQQDEQKVLAPVPPNERGKWVFAEGDVKKAGSPPGNDTHSCYPLWLAYCSAPYFNNLQGDQAVSPEFVTRDFIGEPITNVVAPAKWKAHDRFFMNDISWLSDGTVKAFGADGKETILKYPPPYNFHFVWGQFENMAWTNWNGISIPTTFKITVSHPDYESTNAAKFLTAYTITGTVDQVRRVENFSPVPVLTTKTHITDWRNMRHARPGMFVSTNFWEQSKITNP